jgi:hypothetical protein
MLAKELRDTFLVNKWEERVRARLSLEDLKQTMRASPVTVSQVGCESSSIVYDAAHCAHLVTLRCD